MTGTSFNALPAVYDAALSDERWPEALKQLSREIGAIGGILVAVDQVGLPFQVQQSTYAPEKVDYYFRTHGHHDQETNMRALAAVPPLTLVRDADIWGDVSLLEDRPDYKWLREEIGSRRRAGVRLSANKGRIDMLALQFANVWADMPDIAEGPLKQLLPHLAKAVEVNRQFAILRARYNAALAALDHIRIGTCIVAPSGAIMIANAEARRIDSLDDGLRLPPSGTIKGSTSEASAEIAAKIAAITATATGAGDQPEAILFGDRKSGKRKFIIEIAPLRDSLGELENGLHGAIVFIIDPDNHRDIAIDKMSRLLGFTEAEAEVCRHLINGLSTPEIAEMRGVAEGTIKSQCKAINQKSGTHRRADLLRLALTIDPPIG